MREILFRGKRTDGTGWIEGFYFQKPKPNSDDGRPVYHGITDLPPFDAEVIPETVGQYTGLKDKNGKRIFEGDIVKYSDFPEPAYMAWDQEDARYYMVFSDCMIDFNGTATFSRVEVIGNIHDNPELLEVEG